MSIRFDGNSANHLSRTASLPDYNAPYTIMAWMKPMVDTNARATFFNLATPSANNFDIAQLDTNGTLLAVYCRRSTEILSDTSTDVTIGAWIHVALVRAGVTDLKLYLMGTEDLSVAQDVTGRLAIETVNLGRTDVNGFIGEPLDAEMAHCRIWTTNLTASEIAAEKNSVSVIKTSGLYGVYPMSIGATAGDDTSGQNHPFTVNGTINSGASEPPITGPQLPYFSFNHSPYRVMRRVVSY